MDFKRLGLNRKLVDLKFTLEKGIEGFKPKLRTVTLARESLSKNKFHCASCGKLTRSLGSFFLKAHGRHGTENVSEGFACHQRG